MPGLFGRVGWLNKVLGFVIYYATSVLVMCYTYLFCRIRFYGLDKLKVPRALLASNHSMYLDPAFVCHALLPRRTAYTVLRETFKLPVIGRYIVQLGAFPVHEGMPFTELKRSTEKRLDEYGFVHFFPEGEMYRFNKKLKPFRQGIFALSVLLDLPIIPLVIVANPHPLPLLRRYLRRISIVAGDPLTPTDIKKQDVDISRQELMSKLETGLRGFMEQTIEQYSVTGKADGQ